MPAALLIDNFESATHMLTECNHYVTEQLEYDIQAIYMHEVGHGENLLRSIRQQLEVTSRSKPVCQWHQAYCANGITTMIKTVSCTWLQTRLMAGNCDHDDLRRPLRLAWAIKHLTSNVEESSKRLRLQDDVPAHDSVLAKAWTQSVRPRHAHKQDLTTNHELKVVVHLFAQLVSFLLNVSVLLCSNRFDDRQLRFEGIRAFLSDTFRTDSIPSVAFPDSQYQQRPHKLRQKGTRNNFPDNCPPHRAQEWGAMSKLFQH
eukprot:6466493-Amphidinium_carterae.1